MAWPRESRVGNNRSKYLRALKESALPIDENLILRGEGKLDFGYRATHQLLNLPPTQRPTAIVALNDYMAIGAMQAAQEQGIRIGEDLAISGFDDIPLARYLTPPLTSIRQPIWEIGQHVIQRLIDIIENGQTPEPNACWFLHLIVRASTDPTVKANPLSSKEVMSR